jgi:hypothetical protein
LKSNGVGLLHSSRGMDGRGADVGKLSIPKLSCLRIQEKVVMLTPASPSISSCHLPDHGALRDTRARIEPVNVRDSCPYFAPRAAQRCFPHHP